MSGPGRLPGALSRTGLGLLLGGLLAAITLPTAAQAQLRAAARAKALTLPSDVPLAGYSERRATPDVLDQYEHAHYFPPNAGALPGESVRAKVLVLERTGRKLCFVSLDLVGVDRKLRRKIVAGVASLGFDDDTVFVSATHTHSGPGALSANHFLEFFATDRIHRLFRDDLVAEVVSLVGQANAALEPAWLFTEQFDGASLHKNRTKDAGHGDHALNLLAVGGSAAGAPWIGALLNFAVHGTAHRGNNDRLSADFPGALERGFAKAMGAADPAAFPVLFLNGAEGDQIPNLGLIPMQTQADMFALDAWNGWMNGSPAPTPLPESEWKSLPKDVKLGRPFFYARSKLKPLHALWPFSHLGLELQTYFPTKTRVWSLSLAGMRFMTLPGEPTSDVGIELRAKAKQVGIERLWILGLTNDHLGYFVSDSDWELADYESAGAVYGPHGARRLVNGHLQLLRELP